MPYRSLITVNVSRSLCDWPNVGACQPMCGKYPDSTLIAILSLRRLVLGACCRPFRRRRQFFPTTSHPFVEARRPEPSEWAIYCYYISIANTLFLWNLATCPLLAMTFTRAQFSSAQPWRMTVSKIIPNIPISTVVAFYNVGGDAHIHENAGRESGMIADTRLLIIY